VNLTGILACEEAMPGIPQVAVFDTAFHQTMPEKAYMYALPYAYYEKYGVRRYGFHGTSHMYIAKKAVEYLDKPASELKMIICHLGNGSSITAVDGGKCVDTTMGLTPLEGVPMGTRSGSIDPAILEYVMGNEGLDIHQMTDILNKKSGVLGLSGISSDFRDIFDAANKGNKRAALALDVFVYAIQKYIGGYAVAMNGLDAVIFTAGIGENNNVMRSMIVKNLAILGVKIDEAKNSVRGTVDISAADAKVKTLVIPTNEELMIAADTDRLTRDLVK
jgi:acetate kinase